MATVCPIARITELPQARGNYIEQNFDQDSEDSEHKDRGRMIKGFLVRARVSGMGFSSCLSRVLWVSLA